MSNKVNRSLSVRFIIAAVVIVVSFGFLIYTLYDLQIASAGQYTEKAGEQRVKAIRLTGKRGMIADVDNAVLAMSEDCYNVTFYKTAKENSTKSFQEYTQSILQTIDTIERYGSQLSVKFVIERDPNTNDWVFNFGKGVSEKTLAIRENQWRRNHYLSAKKYPTAADCYEALLKQYQLTDTEASEEKILQAMAVYSEMQMNIFNSEPIIIAKDIPFSAVSEITGRSMVLIGMDVQVGEKRIYPRRTLASQVIGYVGPISDSDRFKEDLKPMGYALNDTIGKDGIEKSMENWLTPNILSRQGERVMERDNQGRLIRQLSYTAPKNGNNVKLTINAAYQQEAERAILKNIENTRSEQERKMFSDSWRETNKDKLERRDFDKFPLQLAKTGAMIVLDVNTARVLAMAQYPTYDLNAMVSGGKEAADILLDDRKLLRNYCIQSRAEPGSIFKMVTGLAALTSERLKVDEQISDEGSFMKYTKNVKDAPVCWIEKGLRYKHANLDIVGGLANSCNYFFYTCAWKLYGDTGSNLLYKYAAQMGLTTKTGIQLPGEARSVVGCQTSLYDPTVSIEEQETATPMLVAASIKKHLRNIGSSYGVVYDENRLNACIKQLMDMAVNLPSNSWANEMRPILMRELNMTRDMVWKQAVIGDIWIYLNDIKWGGGLEVQMAIGQSITLLTPAAVSRYIASIGNGGTVYNLSIIDSIVSPEGEILNQYKPSVFGKLDGVEAYLPKIREGMKGVVDDTGTAKKYFSNWKYTDEIWGKTGTSQITIGNIKLDLENNGWFVTLTPYSTQTEIAVITLIPNGLSGGLTTLANREFIGWWMEQRNKTTTETQVVPGNALMP